MIKRYQQILYMNLNIKTYKFNKVKIIKNISKNYNQYNINNRINKKINKKMCKINTIKKYKINK